MSETTNTNTLAAKPLSLPATPEFTVKDFAALNSLDAVRANRELTKMIAKNLVKRTGFVDTKKAGRPPVVYKTVAVKTDEQ